MLDLFSGSGVVAWYVAERHSKEVIAGDLQLYSAVLAASVIERTAPVCDTEWVVSWLQSAEKLASAHPHWLAIKKLQEEIRELSAKDAASRARDIQFGEEFPICEAYSGFYFSPWQALWIDALRKSLPNAQDIRNIALAALIQSASRCVAAPGHTAQPFKPNETAGRFLLEAWQRDLLAILLSAIRDLAGRRARKKGRAYHLDALELAEIAEPGDLVFLDPPYSGVHYSRFYHVLESIARGHVGIVSGMGRYPSQQLRPSSLFSISSKSKFALDNLLVELSRRNTKVIITFPAGSASNGLSGEEVKVIAGRHFRIEEIKVSSRFSTMGGDLKHRAARKSAEELILTLSSG